MLNFVLLHGKGGLKKDGWFTEVKRFAMSKNIPVLSYSFPVVGNISYLDWKKMFELKILPYLSKDTIMIGHSLGCGFWQKYMTENNIHTPIREALFISPAVKSRGIPLIEDFFKTPFIYENIKKSANEFTIIAGKKDQYIDSSLFEFLAKKIGAKLFLYEDMDHMSQGKYSNHPELISYLKKNY
ncbi:TPA: hypothetical protein EYP45_02940 [Candidatus Peregrinibacteria bacterium]|nr:hypothetical protein [Candidatus Peregrinibacteria bacterium]